MKTINTAVRIIISVALFISVAEAYQMTDILFEDKLNGEANHGWRTAPDNFVDLPGSAKVFLFQNDSLFPQNPPYVGDKNWKNYRIELELLPTGGHWFGFDFHIQEDGLEMNNVQFFTFDTTHAYVVEAASIHGGYKGACSWKLFPYSAKQPVIEKDTWIKCKVDVGDSFANVYLNDMENPVHTAYDLPYSKGGLRFMTYLKSKIYLRNFKITSLDGAELKPLVEDEWATVRDKNIIYNWQVTSSFEAGFGEDELPDMIKSPQTEWINVACDSKGVVNLGQKFVGSNTKGTSFAKTVIYSESEKEIKAWVSYTDRCKIWCNGEAVFQGPKRGWNDPEANHDCRLKPDNYELVLLLNDGSNEIILRSEVTENWGWGFWMRTE